MTDPVLQTQLLRLADGIAGFTVAEAYAALPGEKREAIVAALADLVRRGRIRESGRRYWRIRDDA